MTDVVPNPAPLEPLLQFFKALADVNRLRIIGLLSNRPHSVEELVDVLELRPSTVSHHVAKLAEVRLVSSHVDGHHHVYAIDATALEEMARQILATSAPQRGPDPPEDAYDRKVLATFLDSVGRLKALPMQRKKFEAILRHALRAFEPDRVYSGREVDDRLRPLSDDVASLRRGLIDCRMMARNTAGTLYWRVGPDSAPLPA